MRPKDLTLAVVKGRWLEDWIAEHHYLGYCPIGSRLKLAVYHENRLVGGMLWGRPTSPYIDQKKTLELTRMYLLDECPRNSESYCIGQATRLIRRQLPEIDTLLAYSDPAQGHVGTIYKAAGWTFDGTTRARAWSQRKDGYTRKNIAVGSKMRWIRRLI